MENGGGVSKWVMLFQVQVLFPKYGQEKIIKMAIFEHLEEK